MNFDIAQFMDEGLSFVISILAVYAIYQFGKLVSKHIPAIMEAATSFIKVWHDFTDSMDDNVIAIQKNTKATREGCDQSALVLSELITFKSDWASHDESVDEIKYLIEELRAILKSENENEEVLRLLNIIIDKIEEKDEEDLKRLKEDTNEIKFKGRR